MHPAEHLLLHQRELLASGQLSLAGEAGKARQVVHIALGPAHPVRGVDVAAAARTAGAVPPVEGTQGHWDTGDTMFGTQEGPGQRSPDLGKEGTEYPCFYRNKVSKFVANSKTTIDLRKLIFP